MKNCILYITAIYVKIEMSLYRFPVAKIYHFDLYYWSSITLSWNCCPGVSSRRCICSNTSSSPLSSFVSPPTPSLILLRCSLHSSSKLLPSIWMMRLCRMIQTWAHMMMILCHLMLTIEMWIFLRDWNVPFSKPIVCSTHICICKC